MPFLCLLPTDWLGCCSLLRKSHFRPVRLMPNRISIFLFFIFCSSDWHAEECGMKWELVIVARHTRGAEKQAKLILLTTRYRPCRARSWAAYRSGNLARDKIASEPRAFDCAIRRSTRRGDSNHKRAATSARRKITETGDVNDRT